MPAPTTAPDQKKKLTISEEEAEEAESEPEVRWGIGARSYYTFLPAGVIELFVEHATSMNSASFAASVIRRKGNFDIQLSLEYGKYAPKNGLWEEKGEDPSQGLDQAPDFKDFDNLGMVSGDVAFIWHTDLTDFMQFRYGAGIGIGVKIGNATGIDQMCNSTTTINDLDDPATSGCTNRDGAMKIEEDIPPVLPVVELLLGMRFKIVDELSLNIEAGWRFPAFFVGGGIGYFF